MANPENKFRGAKNTKAPFGVVFSQSHKLDSSRDEAGQMIAASGRSRAGPLDVALVEAIIVREVLGCLKQSPFGRIISRPTLCKSSRPSLPHGLLEKDR